MWHEGKQNARSCGFSEQFLLCVTAMQASEMLDSERKILKGLLVKVAFEREEGKNILQIKSFSYQSTLRKQHKSGDTQHSL